MRTVHLVSLPHTETIPDFSTCAYTAKVGKLAQLLTASGVRVILYAGERNSYPCAEHVTLVTRREQRQWFGPPDLNDLERGGFDWQQDSPWWKAMNGRAAAA